MNRLVLFGIFTMVGITVLLESQKVYACGKLQVDEGSRPPNTLTSIVAGELPFQEATRFAQPQVEIEIPSAASAPIAAAIESISPGAACQEDLPLVALPSVPPVWVQTLSTIGEDSIINPGFVSDQSNRPPKSPLEFTLDGKALRMTDFARMSGQIDLMPQEAADRFCFDQRARLSTWKESNALKIKLDSQGHAGTDFGGLYWTSHETHGGFIAFDLTRGFSEKRRKMNLAVRCIEELDH